MKSASGYKETAEIVDKLDSSFENYSKLIKEVEYRLKSKPVTPVIIPSKELIIEYRKLKGELQKKEKAFNEAKDEYERCVPYCTRIGDDGMYVDIEKLSFEYPRAKDFVNRRDSLQKEINDLRAEIDVIQQELLNRKKNNSTHTPRTVPVSSSPIKGGYSSPTERGVFSVRSGSPASSSGFSFLKFSMTPTIKTASSPFQLPPIQEGPLSAYTGKKESPATPALERTKSYDSEPLSSYSVEKSFHKMGSR